MLSHKTYKYKLIAKHAFKSASQLNRGQDEGPYQTVPGAASPKRRAGNDEGVELHAARSAGKGIWPCMGHIVHTRQLGTLKAVDNSYIPVPHPLFLCTPAGRETVHGNKASTCRPKPSRLMTTTSVGSSQGTRTRGVLEQHTTPAQLRVY